MSDLRDVFITVDTDGYKFGVGFIRAVALWVILPMLVFAIARNVIGWDVDDSDRDGWHRSGARIVTDHKTGLQYFMAPGGGITPRLDVSGQQMRVAP